MVRSADQVSGPGGPDGDHLAPSTVPRPAVRGLSTAVRLVLAGVFLVSGAVKVTDPQLAVQAVRAYRLLPTPLEHTVGWGLPFLEIALGLLLATGLATRAAAVVSSGLLVVFIVAVAAAAVRGLSIDCGCFGGGGTVAPGETRYGAEIARDVVLLLMSFWLLHRPATFFSLDRQPDEPGRRLRSGQLEQPT